MSALHLRLRVRSEIVLLQASHSTRNSSADTEVPGAASLHCSQPGSPEQGQRAASGQAQAPFINRPSPARRPLCGAATCGGALPGRLARVRLPCALWGSCPAQPWSRCWRQASHGRSLARPPRLACQAAGLCSTMNSMMLLARSPGDPCRHARGAARQIPWATRWPP